MYQRREMEASRSPTTPVMPRLSPSPSRQGGGQQSKLYQSRLEEAYRERENLKNKRIWKGQIPAKY
jgi:hypothetical protein